MELNGDEFKLIHSGPVINLIKHFNHLTALVFTITDMRCSILIL